MLETLEPYRTELTGFCYRMLGSGFDAEDAVQEAMLRAWQARDRYDERRGSPRTWIYRIATNVCLDMLRGAHRRVLAVDLGPAATAGPDLGRPLPESRFIHPVPDHRALSLTGDPQDVAVRRDTIRLAFVAALQHLPPRQRAVLILRDVLAWRAEEVAALLDGTVASVTSALQRARATLRAVAPAPADPLKPFDADQRALLARYCRAFEDHDVAALVALLHEDATMSMPPFAWWLRGRDPIRRALLDPAASCAGARLHPVEASGSPAFWQTRPGDGGEHVPFGLILLEVHDGLIRSVITYLDVERLLRLFAAAGAGAESVSPKSFG